MRPDHQTLSSIPLLTDNKIELIHLPDRGQGLNNAVRDAVNICRAFEQHQSGAPLDEVISAYEAELVERGNLAVVSSTKNSIMLHDWAHLTQSPLMTAGVASDQKS